MNPTPYSQEQIEDLFASMHVTFTRLDDKPSCPIVTITKIEAIRLAATVGMLYRRISQIERRV